MMTSNRPRMAVRAVLGGMGILVALAAIMEPWTALSQSAQPVIPLVNGTPGGTASNPFTVAGSFSASFAGFPTVQTTGTPISVTTGGVTGNLPSGTVVVASNVGTTNAAYCKLGASATTSDQYIAPSGGWFSFTVGANTQLTCITSTSTTTVNMVGGSGLPTGTGGGSGGGGGGSGVSTIDEATFTAGTSVFAGTGGFFQTTATNNALTNGQQGMWQMTANRAGFVNLRNVAGAEVGVAAVPLQVSVANTGANATAMLVTGTGGTFPVTGTVTANAGTNLNTSALALDATLSSVIGTKNAGTAATNSVQTGGVYNSTPLTLTNTQQSSLQLDANGYLKVNTAAGAAAGGTSSNFGSGFPTPGTAVGFTDGTNMVAARVGAIANVAAATNMVNTILGCQYNATPLTVTDTRYQSLQCDVAGNARVTVTNANANGQAAAASSSPIVPPTDMSAPLGNIVANNTTAVVVNAAATTLYSLQLYGLGSAPAYLKLYNATSATCGSGTPVKRLMIPAASTAANGAGSNIVFPWGVRFTTGLTYCVTTGIADNDTGAPAAATFLVNLDWK